MPRVIHFFSTVLSRVRALLFAGAESKAYRRASTSSSSSSSSSTSSRPSRCSFVSAQCAILTLLLLTVFIWIVGLVWFARTYGFFPALRVYLSPPGSSPSTSLPPSHGLPPHHSPAHDNGSDYVDGSVYNANDDTLSRLSSDELGDNNNVNAENDDDNAMGRVLSKRKRRKRRKRRTDHRDDNGDDNDEHRHVHVGRDGRVLPDAFRRAPPQRERQRDDSADPNERHNDNNNSDGTGIPQWYDVSTRTTFTWRPALVILTYNRVGYLQTCLRTLLETPLISHFSIYVSQDGNDPDLTWVTTFSAAHRITLVHHPREAVIGRVGTEYLARHYKWCLDELFVRRDHTHVVVLEDDLVVSPDFLTLMTETAPLLDADPSLFCVSSWNDNGLESLVVDARRLYRTQFFPGLGWMTNRRVWDDVRVEFPLDQWDHFMRLDTTHRGRDCIVPEVSRNRNIGEQGTNMGGQFFTRYLSHVVHARDAVETFAERDARTGRRTFTYLALPVYEQRIRDHLRVARILMGTVPNSVAELMSMKSSTPGFIEWTRDADAADPTRLLSRAEHEVVPNEATTTTTTTDKSVAPRVVAVFYRLGEFASLVEPLGLLSAPRSYHDGIIVLRASQRGDFVYLIDVHRFPAAKYMGDRELPAQFRFTRHPSFSMVASLEDATCDSACAGSGLRCEPSHFALVNECSALKAHFPCQRGCRGGVMGNDVPNYVTSPLKPDLQFMCLTTEGPSLCEAKHFSARRLCPCVPS